MRSSIVGPPIDGWSMRPDIQSATFRGKSWGRIPMGTDDNKQVVKAFFDSIALADPEVFRSLLSEDPAWWIPESAAAKNASRLHSVPGERAVRGKDALSTMLFSSGFYRDRRSSPDYDPMR